MSDRVPMTREGYEKLKAELERLEQDEKPKIAEKIALAAPKETSPRMPSTTVSVNPWVCSKPASTP